MTDIAGNYSQAIFQRRGRDEQVDTVMSKSRGELPPPPRRGRIDNDDSVLIPVEHPVKPNGQLVGKRGVSPSLQTYAPLYFPYGYNAQVQISCPLCFHPTDYRGIPFTSAEG